MEPEQNKPLETLEEIKEEVEKGTNSFFKEELLKSINDKIDKLKNNKIVEK